MEETNARFVEKLPEAVSLVTIDASFISLKILLPVIRGWFDFSLLTSHSEKSKKGKVRSAVIALIKPQFEAGRKETARGRGVIRDPGVHRAVLNEVLAFAQLQGFALRGLMRSPILGPKGNVEFLAWLAEGQAGEVDWQAQLDQVI
jgi:23S rRNA (cytidine1920-2'-O)/16S rRNA (cytidine1409-2'-O)-methyltransferase